MNCILLDSDQDIIVENPCYTLETYKTSQPIFFIKNINIPKEYFYIQLVDNAIYKEGTLVLFNPADDATNRTKYDQIYLVECENKFYNLAMFLTKMVHL